MKDWFHLLQIVLVLAVVLVITFTLSGRLRSVEHRVDRLEHVTQTTP